MYELWKLIINGNFMPHGHCLLWRKDLLLMHALPDAIIALSYFVIPIALVFLIRKRDDLVFNWIFVMFSLFIFACGATHVFEIINIWHGYYFAEGLIKTVTAIASIVTAICIWPLIPKVLAFPSNAQLASQNVALEKAQQELEQFVYTASHDLKSPIVTAQGYLGMMKDLMANGEYSEVMEKIDRLEKSNNRMVEIISDLLDLSRFSQIESEYEKVDMAKLLEEIREDLSDALAAHNAVLNIEPGLPAVYANPIKLIQVFDNLINNAIKHGVGFANPLIITVGAKQENGEILYFVQDNGPGIPPEYHKKIFDIFQRLDLSKDGTGIGLSIVKRYMNLIGGDVQVISEFEKGAAFWLRFPGTSPNR